MNTLRRNDSDDGLTITQRNNRSKTSTNRTEISVESIPIDLIIELFSRLPLKYVARCRCISKFWCSILRRPDFTELFMIRSHSRPQILFAVKKHGKFLFFSSPQLQNPDVNSSQVVCANRLMHFPFNDYYCDISGPPVHGWLFLLDKKYSKSKGISKEVVPTICNPSTGQSLILPKLEANDLGVNFYLVYDPIDKQFKVLSITRTNGGNGVFDEHQILTIETGKKLSWRMISAPPHRSYGIGICIDGVLYYRAALDKLSRFSMIVCFDVRSEEFSFMKLPEDSIRVVTKGKLINYNGKLGSFLCGTGGGYVDGRYGESDRIELRILEDAEKNEWLKRTYVLPHPLMWRNLCFVGVTRTNEIVFSPMYLMHFCVFYYNVERNTFTKVGIQGMEAFEGTNYVQTYLDYVEDAKLM